MTRIILKYPFIRHYAGSVFDVEESYGESDPYSFERMSPPKTYLLPDNGKGLPVQLDVSNTVLCPPSVFESADLALGPCRITSVQSENGLLKMDDVQLSEDKQSLSFDGFSLEKGSFFEILDRTNGQILQKSSLDTPFPLVSGFRASTVSLDFSTLKAGFYEVKIQNDNKIILVITVIKCFPLVVTMDILSGRYTTIETIW